MGFDCRAAVRQSQGPSPSEITPSRLLVAVKVERRNEQYLDGNETMEAGRGGNAPTWSGRANLQGGEEGAPNWAGPNSL